MPARRYRDLAHLSNADTYFEDFTAGRRHRALARPRHHDRPHHADRHARQHLAGALQSVDGRRRIPSASSADSSSSSAASRSTSVSGSRPPTSATTRSPTSATPPAGTPRRSSPATPCSPATEITAVRDFPGRPDLGVLEHRAARPQVRAQGRRGREGRDLLPRARARREAAQPLRLSVTVRVGAP